MEGFWIDSCKTHCYVVYGTRAEAQATYDAVDGREWPPRCRSVMKPSHVALAEAQGMIDSHGNASLVRVDSATGEPEEPAAAGRAAAAAVAKVAKAVANTSARVGGVRGGGERSAELRSGAADGAGGMRGSGDDSRVVVDLAASEECEEGAAARAKAADADVEMNDMEHDGARAGCDALLVKGSSAELEAEEEQMQASSIFRLTEALPALYWIPVADEEVEKRRREEGQAEQERLLQQVRTARQESIEHKGVAGGQGGEEGAAENGGREASAAAPDAAEGEDAGAPRGEAGGAPPGDGDGDGLVEEASKDVAVDA